MITNPPQDTTVAEGGNATFQCMAEENGVAIFIGWQFTPSGSSVPVTLLTGTNLTGIEMVTVSDGLRTRVTFSGVRREADGGTVVCVAFGSTSSVVSVPATLTVQCELVVSVALSTFSAQRIQLCPFCPPLLCRSPSVLSNHCYYNTNRRTAVHLLSTN